MEFHTRRSGLDLLTPEQSKLWLENRHAILAEHPHLGSGTIEEKAKLVVDWLTEHGFLHQAAA